METPEVDEGVREAGVEAGDDHDREDRKGGIRGGLRVPAVDDGRVKASL